jgi:cellulose synthase/poly-beta-1,6-N-acetylglucosamine synthase-like glycosyltransferase
MVAEVIFIITLILLAWTYLLYPVFVITMAERKRKRVGRMTTGTEEADPELPYISVIMSVYNEEKVLEEKVRSLLQSDYPHDLAEFIVGSDGSDDATELIMQGLAASDHRIRFLHNDERRGKPAMLNDLAAAAKGEILVITDANVLFSGGTLKHLAKGFRLPSAGICDATVTPRSYEDKGVTRQENFYSRFEAALKRAEGDLWGVMPGPYGGCYAIRRGLFPALPPNTLVDDLYVGLAVLGRGFSSFNVPEAVVIEDTQSDLAAQFRRRVRIAAGSFQNLFRFGLFPSRRVSACLAFISHKVLRWSTPLLLLLFFMTTIILSGRSECYFWLSAIQLIFLILSALDLVADRFGRKIKYQRYVTQFLLMNAALAAGFVKAVKGIKSGIWEPTKRV